MLFDNRRFLKNVFINKQLFVCYLYKYTIIGIIVGVVIKMKEKKNDLRVVKTQNLLYQTLVDLLKDKPFEEIKVSDICGTALINRSTFYAHYNDKYELLAAYINSLKDALTRELEKNNNISNSKEYYMEMIKLFLDHIEEKKNVYISVMINNQNSITMDILYDVISSDVTKRIQNDDLSTGGIPSGIISKFYIGAVLSVGLEWLRNSSKYTKEEIINYLDLLIPKDLNRK